MELIFYKSAAGTITDKLINRLSCNGGYSHVEIRFEDEQCFTSSPRDGGVRMKYIQLDSEHWDTFVLPNNVEKVVRRYAEINASFGAKYDWNGVFGFVFPIKDNKKRRFCSEICLMALQHAGLLRGIIPTTVSPNSLKLIVEARFGCKEGL